MSHADGKTIPAWRAFLGMPGYGSVTAGAAKGFWLASRFGESNVWHQYQEGSLLAANFNILWCQALNNVHSGRRTDYFAMQHADVEPLPGWLDLMIDELEATGLDVLGAVVPIKDTRGITSIAVQRPDGDRWNPLCRLTMHEVYRLPETFTAEDVGHPILLNTGLWVCRFDESWAKQVGFTVRDRIVFDTEKDRYQHQTESEDWYFSRQLLALGLKIGATRKVKLQHRGDMAFTNMNPWGSDRYDSASRLTGSILPPTAPDPDGFEFPTDVEGWLSPIEGKALAELAKGRRVLEVGSYCGLSTVCLARTAAHVTAIDPHDGRGTPIPRGTLDALKANLVRFGVNHKVTIRVSTSRAAHAVMNGDRFDLAFIDGAHDVDAVRTDIAVAMGRLDPGGLIAFHDYRQYPGQHDGGWDPGVTQAVDELIQSGGELISTHDSLAVVRPPAATPSEV